MWIIWGGGCKGYVAPPLQNYFGGLPPALFLRLCSPFVVEVSNERLSSLWLYALIKAITTSPELHLSKFSYEILNVKIKTWKKCGFFQNKFQRTENFMMLFYISCPLQANMQIPFAYSGTFFKYPGYL